MGSSDPNALVLCKKSNGAKMMAWIGDLNGQVLPVYWIAGSVNSDTYVEMLKTVVWPAVRGRVTRRQHWFLQDSASPQCIQEVLVYMHSKFGNRVISRRQEHYWPP